MSNSPRGIRPERLADGRRLPPELAAIVPARLNELGLAARAVAAHGSRIRGESPVVAAGFDSPEIRGDVLGAGAAAAEEVPANTEAMEGAAAALEANGISTALFRPVKAAASEQSNSGTRLSEDQIRGELGPIYDGIAEGANN